MEDAHANTVIVGIDGSAPSKLALKWAAQQATRRGVGLDVVHAWSPPAAIYAHGFDDPKRFEEAAATVLDDTIAWLDEAGGIPAEVEVRPVLIDAEPASALLQAAAQGDHLLVVGSRGHGGFVELLLGSVSQRVVAHPPCPVAVVPPTWKPDWNSRMVVGVDGSASSYGALQWAVAEAGRRGITLDVVNAFDYHASVMPFGPVPKIHRDDLAKASRVLLEDVVGRALHEANAQTLPVELISSALGAAHAVLEVADGADLVVVGSRGRGTFTGVLLGSVSQQCVHHARCPVVVVPRPGT